jgi:putative endonuclease
MPALYILQNTTTQKYYVGSALDLPARIAEHRRGHSLYTRNRGPWVLVYQEQFATLAEARRRERQVKSWKSHRSIQELIQQAVG